MFYPRFWAVEETGWGRFRAGPSGVWLKTVTVLTPAPPPHLPLVLIALFTMFYPGPGGGWN